MDRDTFNRLVEEEFPNAIPERFREHIKNVAFLIEDDPSDELRHEEGLHADETLLGHYRGIPITVRGDGYGFGITMPDTITLFCNPILDAAKELNSDNKPAEDAVRQVIRDTIWHEVAHHFGMDETRVRARESERESSGGKVKG